MKIFTYLVLFLIVSTGLSFSKEKIDLDKIIKNEPNITITEVVESPKLFHKKKILVEGKVSKVKFATLPNGKKYTAFKLKDDNRNVLRVYAKGYIEGFEEGLNVRIYGKYRKERKYLIKNFKNVVKAKKVLVLSTVALNN